MSKEMLIDKKMALIIDGKRITEYEYDFVSETENEIVLWSNNRLAIYNKETCEKLYEYTRNGFKSTVWVHVYKSSVVIDTGDKFFIVKSDGSAISNQDFDKCDAFYVESEIFFEVTIGKKAGIYSTEAKELIPLLYDKVSIDNNFVVVERDGKKGLYNLKGDAICTSIFDEILVTPHYIVTYIKEANQKVIHDLNGNTIFTGDRHCKISYNEIGILVANWRNKVKYSLYAFDGTPILEEYDNIEIGDIEADGTIIAIKDEKQGLFDFSGKELLPLGKYKRIVFGGLQHYEFGVVTVRDEEENYGIYSVKQEKIVVPLKKYIKLISYSNGICEMITENAERGYYLSKEDWFVKAQDINVTKSGKYEFLIDGKWILYNGKDEELPCQVI